MHQDQPLSKELRGRLSAAAEEADRTVAWPAPSWQALREAGVLGWSIPHQYGGLGWSARQLLDGYEALASACLTTAFILSQRESAARRILAGNNEALKRDVLPALASGQAFATVGLSQLTTSRQHGGPALVARPRGSGYTLDGAMPWVTGAEQAAYIVTGAALEDGRQILAVLPRGLDGVSIEPALDLMAVRGSLTTEVRCQNVYVDPGLILDGPKEKVLAAGGKGGTGGVETSCLALGLAGAAVDYVAEAAERQPDWRPAVQRLEAVRRQLRTDMHALAEGLATPDAAARLRARANAFVLRATQTALVAAKGTGFVHPHPAQRWARQALFFLVWSCPRPAAEATLGFLGGPDFCPN